METVLTLYKRYLLPEKMCGNVDRNPLKIYMCVCITYIVDDSFVGWTELQSQATPLHAKYIRERTGRWRRWVLLRISARKSTTLLQTSVLFVSVFIMFSLLSLNNQSPTLCCYYRLQPVMQFSNSFWIS